MSKKPEVAIAVMTVDGRVYANIAQTLLGWVGKHENYVCNNVMFIQGLRPLPTARNAAVKSFLDQKNADYLIQWDHDIFAPKNAIDRLVAHGKDIVSSNCLMMQIKNKCIAQLGPASWVKHDTRPGKYKEHWGHGLERVDTVTGGFFMVSRAVYESYGPPWFQYGYNDTGIMTDSCEIFFARQAQDKGFDLYTDYDVLCDHVNYARYIPLLYKMYLIQETAKGRSEREVIEEIHKEQEKNGEFAGGLNDMWHGLPATDDTTVSVETIGAADEFTR